MTRIDDDPWDDEEEEVEEERPPNPQVVFVFSGLLLVLILFAFAQVVMAILQAPDPVMFVPAAVLLVAGIFGIKSVLRALNTLAHKRTDDDFEDDPD